MKNQKGAFINKDSSCNYYLKSVPETLVDKRGSDKC